jgi:hypothetical protein
MYEVADAWFAKFGQNSRERQQISVMSFFQHGNGKGGALPMDETTKLIIAYAATLSGIPIIAAKILWLVPGAISSMILVPISRGLDQAAGEVFAGFISLLLACFLFEHLGLKIAFKIPISLIIVNTFWNPETFHIVPFVVGTVTGFVLYPKVLLLLPLMFPLSNS